MATLLLPTAHPAHHIGQPWTAIPRAVFAESRPPVQLIFLMRSTAASGIVYHPTTNCFAGIGAWALITISIYVFNGVTDLVGDRANHSARPLASGLLSRTTALTWCAMLSITGLGIC